MKIEKAERTIPIRPTHFIFDFIFISPFIEKKEIGVTKKNFLFLSLFMFMFLFLSLERFVVEKKKKK
jgi:hypothetical protein